MLARKALLVAAVVAFGAGLVPVFAQTEAGDIVVTKIRLVTPHYEYMWTEDGGILESAAAVADAGVTDSTVTEAAAVEDAGVTDSTVTEAAAVADAGVQPSAVLSWTALYPGRKMTLAEFEREVLRTERRLVDTGLFYSVSVHIVPPRRKPLERTVVITVSDGFPYRYSGGNAFVMFGRNALGGNRASVYVYAGWNLFGVEAVHENLGNRGYLLEATAFSHDFLPSLCDVDGAEPRNELAFFAGKFLSPDVSLAMGPGLVTVADTYNRGYSFHPFGEAVLRVSRLGFLAVESEWTFESRAAWFPLDSAWKLGSSGTFSAVIAEDIFGKANRGQRVELYFSGAGGRVTDGAPEALSFSLHDSGEQTVRSGYPEDELTLVSYVFASAEVRFDFGTLVFLSGFSVIPQIFLFTDAALPSPGPEWDGTVLDAYGAGLRLKFPSPVFTDGACSWGINHDGAWRIVFFVQTKK